MFKYMHPLGSKENFWTGLFYKLAPSSRIERLQQSSALYFLRIWLFCYPKTTKIGKPIKSHSKYKYSPNKIQNEYQREYKAVREAVNCSQKWENNLEYEAQEVYSMRMA